MYKNERGRYVQELTQYQDDFYLDSKGILQKKPTPRDCAAEIESYRSSSLDSILDKFLENGTIPGTYQFDENVVEVNNRQSDLDYLLEVDQLIDEYRTEMKKPNASKAQILNYIREKGAEALEKLKKGVLNNDETSNVEKSEPQEFSQNGSESSAEEPSA